MELLISTFSYILLTIRQLIIDLILIRDQSEKLILKG